MSTTVKAQKREQKENASLRQKGFIPAVVYGYKMDTQAVAVSEKELLKIIREVGRNGVLKLDVEGTSVNVVMNDYQMNVLKGEMIHVDFLAINMKEELEVSVQVHLVGTSVGVSEGGMIQQPNREIIITVKPSDIPENIDVDVSGLSIGDILTVADIRDKTNYTIINEDDFALAIVSAPRVEEEPEESDAVAVEEKPAE